MPELESLLAGIVTDPLEETRWLVLADWLEEFDDPLRAELLRIHRKMLATCCEPDEHPERARWQSRMVELLIAGVRPCMPQETLMLPGGVPMTFSFIPPGEFLMGSEKGNDDERPVHRVEVSRGFFMGVSPVTQAQWAALMETAPSNFKGEARPVENVSWDDCREFCLKLSNTSGYRVELPTEAEWEYACRAGTTTDYYFGDVISTDLANYNGKYCYDSPKEGEDREQTTDVSSFPANPWGLFDMHGNVGEWCADAYDHSAKNKQDISDRNVQVVRGGAWVYPASCCRAASRDGDQPKLRINYYGFRVCFRAD